MRTLHRSVLFMLATGKMARKVIPVKAHVTANVALEWMFVTVAAHVNGVENIISELNFTMLALIQEPLLRRRRGGLGRAVMAPLRRNGAAHEGVVWVGVAAGVARGGRFSLRRRRRRRLHAVHSHGALLGGDLLYEDGLLLTVRGGGGLRLRVNVSQLAG